MASFDDWLERAREIVGENLLTDERAIEPYAHDEFAVRSYDNLPLAVVKPKTEEQVAAVVALCAEMGVPVTARGGGTGLSAACVPSANGVILSLERLNGVVEKDAANHAITLQAGATLEKLYREVEEMHLYFPPHPGEEGAFVGGAVATNAGGARAVKYGTMKRFVAGLQVVLADGSLVDLGGKLIKSSTGYNLLDLMIGSEGTLGIMTRVTLSLLPPPGHTVTLVVPFPSVDDAMGAVAPILDAGIIPTAVEFVEHSVLLPAERLVKKPWPTHRGSASLMIVLDGASEDAVLAACEKLAALLEGHGALDTLLAESKAQQADILEVRSMIYEALKEATVELFDVCVPRAEIAAHVRFVHELEAKYDLPLPTYGHAADGNVHTHFLKRTLENGEIGPDIPDWPAKYEAVKEELYRDAVQRGGVISGEHGIGLSKRRHLTASLGERKVEMMRAVKRALDPKGILNPGKIFEL